MNGYEDKVREHSFDGIQEFDNRLPNWWLWSFYLACIFSVGYWIHFHTLGTGALGMEAYEIHMSEVSERLMAQMAGKQATDEDLLKLSQEMGAVEQGRTLFMEGERCVTCHGPQGNGKGETGNDLPGINLTDDWWIHGNTPMDIYNTVKNGAENGMQAWGPLLGETKVRQLVSFVLTLKGKNIAGKSHEVFPDLGRAKKLDND